MIFFFFNDTATTEIYTLSLHDALPICHAQLGERAGCGDDGFAFVELGRALRHSAWRSEEHTSELQSRLHLVCRLLLEKKKNKMRRRVLALQSLMHVLPHAGGVSHQLSA